MMLIFTDNEMQGQLSLKANVCPIEMKLCEVVECTPAKVSDIILHQ